MPYPITELFAWVVDDPTGDHGIIGVLTPGGWPMQAVSSNRALLESEDFKGAVAEAAKVTGHQVHLKRFLLAERLATVPEDN